MTESRGGAVAVWETLPPWVGRKILLMVQQTKFAQNLP